MIPKNMSTRVSLLVQTVAKIRLRSRQQCCLITTCKRWSISIFVFGSITQDVEMWWLSLSVPTVLKVFLCGRWGKDWVPWMEVHDYQTLVRIVYDLGGIPMSSNLDLCVMQGWKSCRERDHYKVSKEHGSLRFCHWCFQSEEVLATSNRWRYTPVRYPPRPALNDPDQTVTTVYSKPTDHLPAVHGSAISSGWRQSQRCLVFKHGDSRFCSEIVLCWPGFCLLLHCRSIRIFLDMTDVPKTTRRVHVFGCQRYPHGPCWPDSCT